MSYIATVKTKGMPGAALRRIAANNRHIEYKSGLMLTNPAGHPVLCAPVRVDGDTFVYDTDDVLRLREAVLQALPDVVREAEDIRKETLDELLGRLSLFCEGESMLADAGYCVESAEIRVEDGEVIIEAW